MSRNEPSVVATVRVPGDKSITHRALMLSAIASGESRLRGLLSGEDCRSTAAAMRALGAEIPDLPSDGAEIRVRGVGRGGLHTPDQALDCGNSGTTARLLLGLLAGLPVEARLTGDDSLRSRPMRRVTDPLGEMGAEFIEEGDEGRLPITVRGGDLDSILYRSPVSSAQIKSALLFAAVAAEVEATVVEPTRSRDHTERMLRRMGASVREAVTPDGWEVTLEAASHKLQPLDLGVPGDFSSAAFLVAFALLRGGSRPLRIANVGLNPTRSGFLDVVRRMGADVVVENLRGDGDPSAEAVGDLVVRPSELRGVEVTGETLPLLIDEVPVLAALAAHSKGGTEIRDARELRVKETDRIRALVENLAAVGVQVEELEDGLRIEGAPGALRGAIAARHDHRISMAFGVLGAVGDNRIEVDDRAVADVSFPGFWGLLEELSGPDREAP